jgi:hypothetical protein
MNIKPQLGRLSACDPVVIVIQNSFTE